MSIFFILSASKNIKIQKIKLFFLIAIVYNQLLLPKNYRLSHWKGVAYDLFP